MKFFKFLKSVKGHTVGTIVEMDEADPTVETYLAAGIIAEEKGAEDAIVAKAVEKLSDTFAKAVAPAIEKALATVTETVSKGVKGGVEPGEQKADREKSLGNFVKCVAIMEHPESGSREKAEAADLIQNLYKSPYNNWSGGKGFTGFGTKASGTMVESSGPSGGYGVPPEYATEVYKLAIEDTILASKARKRPMASNQLIYPKLNQTSGSTQGTYTGYLGGVVAAWQPEDVTANNTRVDLKQGVLKAGELRGYTVLSNELLADNVIGLEALLRELFVEAIGYYTDLATLVGDGADKPIGVLNAPASIVQARSSSNTFTYTDAINMESKLLPKSASTAFWVMEPSVKPQLYAMADGSSRNIWLPNVPGAPYGPAGQMPPQQLLGHPIYFTEKLPTLGTKGDVMLIDPLGYMIGERAGIDIAVSPHVNFLKNEMTYRFIARIGGQPMLDLPYTKLNSGTLSTFVVLNT